MNQKDLPPIEPLSPEAWARIEHDVFARLDQERREATPRSNVRVLRLVSLASAAGVAFAAAAMLALWLRGGSEPAAPAHAVATATSAAASPPASAVAANAPVAETAPVDPQRVDARRVEDGAHVLTNDLAEQLRIGDSEVVLAARSELDVKGSDERGWLLELVRGRIDVHVAPRAQRPDFVTHAGEVEVRVVGTRFSVERDTARGARVTVEEGKVRVSERGQNVLLTAGDSWSGFERPPLAGAKSASARRAAAAERARIDFERATRLESSDPAKALGIYAELGARRGPWAANALYAAARLEHERGNTQRASTLLKRYLERYPKGANASDARALLAHGAR
jgi:FecR-like protein